MFIMWNVSTYKLKNFNFLLPYELNSSSQLISLTWNSNEVLHEIMLNLSQVACLEMSDKWSYATSYN